MYSRPEPVKKLDFDIPEGECKAQRDFRLGPNTEVHVRCGIKKDQHGSSHLVRDFRDDMHITFQWGGEFVE